jgi:hypothetical protein
MMTAGKPLLKSTSTSTMTPSRPMTAHEYTLASMGASLDDFFENVNRHLCEEQRP